jgi:hypothetical protein
MRTLLKTTKSSFLMALVTMALMLVSSTEAFAQPAPLMVINTTPCTIWVQGQTGSGLTAGCATPWVMVPSGSAVSLTPCAGPAFAWYHVFYSQCMPGIGCPQGTTNSSVAICGIPTVMIPNCTGTGPFMPVWTGTASVQF